MSATPIQQTNHSRQPYSTIYGTISSGIKYFSAGLAMQILSALCIQLNGARDFKISLPQHVYQLSQKFQQLNGYQGFGRFGSLFLTAPLVEEVVFRLLLQEVLLKKTPLLILKNNAPLYRSTVNSATAATARIIVCAAMFSLIHAASPQYPYDSAFYLFHKFIVGVCCGTIQEMTGNEFLAIAFHSGGNLIPALFLK